MMKRTTALLIAALCLTTPAFAVLDIDPTFSDTAGETWTATRMGVVNQAISEWESVFATDAQANGQTVNVTFDFTNACTGGYIGQWSGGYSLSYTTTPDNPASTVRPWDVDTTVGGDYTRTTMTHTIHLNADFFTGTNYTWFDPTPLTDGDQPFVAYDALSIIRHEIGHMMGFTELYGTIAEGTSTLVSEWAAQVTGATFDQGGLDLPLASVDNIAHFSDAGGAATEGDLMVPAIPNSLRRGISLNDIDALETAYGYDLVPEPATMSLLALGGIALLKRRKK